MIYGRVTVLVLFVMLFVGIWSSDQPAVRQEYAARHRGEIHVVGGRSFRGTPRRHRVLSSKTSAKPIQLTTRRSTATDPIPAAAIPRDLSVGTYRVVNSAGLTTTVRVTVDWLPRQDISTELPSREFYIHQTSSECWYWIRLQPGSSNRSTAGL